MDHRMKHDKTGRYVFMCPEKVIKTYLPVLINGAKDKLQNSRVSFELENSLQLSAQCA